MNRDHNKTIIYLILIFLVQVENFRLLSAAEIFCSVFPRGERQLVSPERINDNYCDCPEDGGIDEPNTAACSGAVDGGWPGIDLIQTLSPPYFQCKALQKQKLPLSRVNDGICDCCDGSDESETSITCQNSCEELLAKENAAKKRMKEEFQLGYDARNRDIARFQNLIQSNRQNIENIQLMEITPLQREMEILEASIEEEKYAFINKYTQRMHDTYHNVGSMLPGTVENLKMLIEAACHLNGEMTDPNTTQGDSCVALGLAGLDLGIIWKYDTDQLSVRKWDRDSKSFAMEIFRIFAGSTEKDATQDRSTKNTSVFDDDDYYSSADASQNDHSSTNEYLLYHDPFMSFFKLTRKPFYSQAKKVIREIDSELEKAVDSEIQQSNNHSEDDNNSEKKDPVKLDRTKLRMIKDHLSRKIGNVERGVTWSKSARNYLQSLEALEDEDDFKNDLIKLTAGIIFHARLRGVDIVEIVSMYGLNLNEYTDACFLPTMAYCPAIAKEYINLTSGTLITFPTESLLKDTTSRCVLEHSESYNSVCSGKEEDILQSDDIINSTADGYFHYFEHRSRDENDFFTILFSQIEDSKGDIANINKKESVVIELKQKIDAAQGKIHELERETGGNYGPDGILYGLRDECFEVKNGKYIYEVCIMGNAYQRDDQEDSDNRFQKGTGTFLGKWQGMSSDDDFARKIMKWTDGTMCFQGTARSATVFVSCGSETVLLSAEEPNTCEYVLTMQSPMACDDNYKKKYCSQLSLC